MNLVSPNSYLANYIRAGFLFVQSGRNIGCQLVSVDQDRDPTYAFHDFVSRNIDEYFFFIYDFFLFYQNNKTKLNPSRKACNCEVIFPTSQKMYQVQSIKHFKFALHCLGLQAVIMVAITGNCIFRFFFLLLSDVATIWFLMVVKTFCITVNNLFM